MSTYGKLLHGVTVWLKEVTMMVTMEMEGVGMEMEILAEKLLYIYPRRFGGLHDNQSNV